MTNAYFYSNLAVQTSLSGSISNVALAITVGATTGFPASFPYVLALDFGGAAEELVTVTNAAGTTLTLGVRGFGGTSAQSHSLGAVVRHTYNAVDATDFRTHEASTGAVHGLTGMIVGTSDTQVLSNKTLTSPTITGTVGGSATYTTPGITTPTITSGGSWAGSPTISTPSITTPVITAGGSWAGSPTFTTPTITDPLVTGIATTDVPLIVRGVASQTGNLTKWQNSAATALSWIDSQGIPHWNNGERVGGLDQLTIDVNGNLSTSGTISASNFTPGAWTTYTPTWQGSITNPTIGNGSITGTYTVVGKLVTVSLRVTMGTTTTFGSGLYTFGLPFNSAARTNGWIGSSLATDAGNANYAGIVQLGPSSNVVAGINPVTASGGNPSGWTNTSPFTWGSGDQADLTITYEMA